MLSWLFSLFILFCFILFPSSFRCHGSRFSPTSKGFASHSERQGSGKQTQRQLSGAGARAVPGPCCWTGSRPRLRAGAALSGWRSSAQSGQRERGWKILPPSCYSRAQGGGPALPRAGYLSASFVCAPFYLCLAHLSVATGSFSSVLLLSGPV